MNISFIGVIICFIGSFLGALGDKFVHDSYSKDENENYKISRKNLWLLGILLSVVIDSSFTMIALYFTSAALVTPFAGVHILWNLIITNICLKIRTKLHQYMGSIFLICGIVIINTFSEKKVDIKNMNYLISMYSQTKVIIYLICVFSVIFILLILCLIPLCFHNMDKSKYLKKLKFFYSRKLVITPSKKLYTNSFVQKIKIDTKSFEKKFLHRSKNYYENSIHYSNSNKNTNDNLIGFNVDKTYNNDENIFIRKNNSSFLFKSDDKSNLDNQMNKKIIENLNSLPNNSIVVINKQEIYINLMNNFYSKDSIIKLTKNKLFESNFREVKKYDSTKLTKKKNICKKYSKDHKLCNIFNLKKNYNEKGEKYKYPLFKKKDRKLRNKKRNRFCLILNNKMNKNTVKKKENSSLNYNDFFQNESNISDRNDEEKYIIHNNNPLLLYSDSQNLDYNENKTRKKNDPYVKKKESYYYIDGHSTNDSKIIEIDKENDILMLQRKDNNEIDICLNGINKENSEEKKEKKEKISKNDDYNERNDIPLKHLVKKYDTSLNNTINEYDNNINNDIINNEDNINNSDDNVINNDDDGNSNINQLQYMSFITAIYKIPSKSKKIYTETIYYGIYCGFLCGISGGLVNIFFEQIIGVFSQEKFYMFENFLSYFLIFLALFCLSNQLIFLNVSLSHFNVTSVIPLIMSNIVFFSSLSTIIMQLKDCKLKAINAISFSFGVFLVILGILYLQYNINDIIIKHIKKKKK
ncbi:conserved Plasmodium protein, unknown function [Plasmodium gallinaceum]|uniref:Magnesium transporter n=1 Tax=Plasmodium gallinaceum TaxID=5849 RepID=A0A1J1GM55_PLAGA|nr:conserved Plasmodium protein, unknown function [Plasmodium gallinaceum]CRG93502.1 conserved Plasmodium protein, unknown function [Plasmodium gallinaceum]